ncbi:MAG: DMT family transporter [Methylococcales bacterium]|nr:DMT family transporter [Methylococcales bacterium]MCK5478402.1 DMT family transporter [Methylococcales bacterium]
MRIALAYISVIILWATTPLAIKWSGEGPGFIFGAGSRMTIGAICMLCLLIIRRKRLPSHKKAKQTYLAVAIQIYGAMLSVYWGAQFIPSGWVSVIFGLSPFITAFFAAIWLKERSLTFAKIVSYLLGLSGLAIMFSSALQLNIQAVYGIMSILAAVSLQTASAVWVKRIHAKLPAATQVTGGLLFALPAYLITWIVFDDAQWPQYLSVLNIASIVYLGIIATTIGFVLYYYVLIHLPATTVGFIPMISPVLALYLGHTINQELLTAKIVTGTTLILSALIMHEFFDKFIVKLFKKAK